jgi:hypothetical protein
LKVLSWHFAAPAPIFIAAGVDDYVCIGMGDGGIYVYASIAMRKGALVIVPHKSFWNFLESSKGLYKCDIATRISN